MNVLINFVTIIAWIWGVIAFFLLAIVCADQRRRFDSVCLAIIFGGLPWGWLLARYVL
jgi:hypothetical protein